MGQYQFSYTYQEPSLWLEHFSTCFPSTLYGNELRLDKPFGEGRLNYEVIQEGLWIQFLKFKVYSSTLIRREGISTNDIFTLTFFLSENTLKQTIQKGREISYSFQDINMLFSSSKVSACIDLEANKWINLVQVSFNKQWLTNNIDLENYRLKEFFMKDEPIFISENLDHRSKTIIANLSENAEHKLNLASSIYQILEYFLFKFNGRILSSSNKKFHKDDTDKLLKAKSYLDKNVCENVSIKILCELIQMSRSKFKRLFTQVFGKPPYRYHLENKLEKGKELIETKRLSISETAFFLGYDDHGSFTRAFKKHYGYLPSEL